MTKRDVSMRDVSMIDDETESSYVRELLQAGRDDVSGYDIDKGLSKHLALVATGAPMPDWAQALKPVQTAATGGGAAATASSGALWVGLPIAIATVVATVFYANDAPVQRAVPVPAPTVIAAPAAPAPVVVEDNAVIAPSRPAVREAEPAKATRRAAPARTKGRALLAASERLPATQAKSVEDIGFETASPEPSVAPEPQAQAEAAKPARPEAEAPQQDDASLEREMGMLSMAQRLLHSDPARALSLARRGESEFAGSMFTQERQQVLLLCLVKLGRIEEAKRLAKPYLARYPNSPFSDRVRRAILAGSVER